MLSNTYEDDTMATRIALKARFDSCSMADETAHPNEWFTELEQIKRRLNTTFNYVLNDDDLIDHILMKLPKAYSEVVTSIATSKTKHTLSDVKQSVRAHFIRVVKDSDSNSKKEVALYAGGFKGKCHNCGKIGHKSIHCKQKRSKFNGNCGYCHKKGHREHECFKKKRDQRSGPSGSPPNNPSNTPQTSSNRSDEIALMAIEDLTDAYDFCVDAIDIDLLTSTSDPKTEPQPELAVPTTQTEYLKDKWILDSGASSHMCGRDILQDTKTISKKVFLGDKSQLIATKQGTVIGTTTTSTMVTTLRLTEVLYVPGLMYNLLSLSKISQSFDITVTKTNVTFRPSPQD